MQNIFLEEGYDAHTAGEWQKFHMRRCLHPFFDAQECQVELKASLFREMKEKMGEEQWQKTEQVNYSISIMI